MSRSLQIVTLADDAFALPLAVLLRSALDHLPAEGRLDVCVVDGGVRESTRRRLALAWADPRLRVEWRPPPAGLDRLPVAGRIPPLTYARLSLPELVAPDCTRAVVLDADQLVLTDLNRLAALPFDGAHVLAPRDPFIPCVSSPNGLHGYAELGLARDAPYFTGALMVADVEAWRRDSVRERALAYVAARTWRIHSYDQDALNAVLAGRWRELDARWQVQPRVFNLAPSVTPHLDAATRERLLADPWVVHFSGRLKPWLYEGRGAFDARYREVLARTPFADAPPPDALRARLYRAYDGRLRRWLYPLERRVDAALRALQRRDPAGP